MLKVEFETYPQFTYNEGRPQLGGSTLDMPLYTNFLIHHKNGLDHLQISAYTLLLHDYDMRSERAPLAVNSYDIPKSTKLVLAVQPKENNLFISINGYINGEIYWNIKDDDGKEMIRYTHKLATPEHFEQTYLDGRPFNSNKFGRAYYICNAMEAWYFKSQEK